jgi:hypothetical protein
MSRSSLLRIGLCVATIAWLLRPSRPAIIRLGAPASIRGEVALFVANPLRDRAPEETAERLLLLLKQGRCIEAFKFAGGVDDARIKEVCELRAASLPVSRWELIDRVDRDGVVDLQYRCELRRWEEYLRITVTNSPNGWHILSWAFPPGA